MTSQDNSESLTVYQWKYLLYLAILKFWPRFNVNWLIENQTCTLLHYFARLGSARHLKCLIARGAEVDKIEGRTGMTALMMACRYGDNEMVKVLLNAGANPLINAKDGRSAFSCAFVYQSEETFGLVFDKILEQNEGISVSHLLTYIVDISYYDITVRENVKTRNELMLFSRWKKYLKGKSKDMQSVSVIIESLIHVDEQALNSKIASIVFVVDEQQELPLMKLLLRHMYRDELTLESILFLVNEEQDLSLLKLWLRHMYRDELALASILLSVNEQQDLSLLKLLLRHMYRHRKDENTLLPVVEAGFTDALNKMSPLKILSAYALFLDKMDEISICNYS